MIRVHVIEEEGDPFMALALYVGFEGVAPTHMGSIETNKVAARQVEGKWLLNTTPTGFFWADELFHNTDRLEAKKGAVHLWKRQEGEKDGCE